MWVLMIEASGASIRGRLARISVSLYVITHHKTFMSVDLMQPDVYSQSRWRLQRLGDQGSSKDGAWNRPLYSPHWSSGSQTCSIGATGLAPAVFIRWYRVWTSGERTLAYGYMYMIMFELRSNFGNTDKLPPRLRACFCKFLRVLARRRTISSVYFYLPSVDVPIALKMIGDRLKP